MEDSLKDWPQALKRNAAVIELAHAMFKARAEAYGGRRFLVDEPPSVRTIWITRADEFLKTVQPAPPPARVAPIRPALDYFGVAVHAARQHFTTGLRPTHGPVIGQIDPPEGEAS